MAESSEAGSLETEIVFTDFYFHCACGQVLPLVHHVKSDWLVTAIHPKSDCVNSGDSVCFITHVYGEMIPNVLQ